VIGGYFDNEFSKDTILFFEYLKKTGVILLVSDLVDAELRRAPIA